MRAFPWSPEAPHRFDGLAEVVLRSWQSLIGEGGPAMHPRHPVPPPGQQGVSNQLNLGNLFATFMPTLGVSPLAVSRILQATEYGLECETARDRSIYSGEVVGLPFFRLERELCSLRALERHIY